MCSILLPWISAPGGGGGGGYLLPGASRKTTLRVMSAFCAGVVWICKLGYYLPSKAEGIQGTIQIPGTCP